MKKKKKKKISSQDDDEVWWSPSYVCGPNHPPGVGDITVDMKPYDVMTPARATEYRSVTARANFLAADRGDIIYTVKECARCMSEPTEQDRGN